MYYYKGYHNTPHVWDVDYGYGDHAMIAPSPDDFGFRYPTDDVMNWLRENAPTYHIHANSKGYVVYIHSDKEALLFKMRFE